MRRGVQKRKSFANIRTSLLRATGRMAEWSNAPDSKSGIRLYRIVGSNPTPSARKPHKSGLPSERPNFCTVFCTGFSQTLASARVQDFADSLRIVSSKSSKTFTSHTFCAPALSVGEGNLLAAIRRDSVNLEIPYLSQTSEVVKNFSGEIFCTFIFLAFGNKSHQSKIPSLFRVSGSFAEYFLAVIASGCMSVFSCRSRSSFSQHSLNLSQLASSQSMPIRP